MSRPDEWIHRILDRMAPIRPAEPSNLDRLDGVGATMSDRESREQEARDIAQEAAEAGVPATHYMLGLGELDEPERCEANAKRGTGTGMCNRPLDETGHCDREGDHL
jgi:hypothetical protein